MSTLGYQGRGLARQAGRELRGWRRLRAGSAGPPRRLLPGSPCSGGTTAGRGRGPAREDLSPWRARRSRAINGVVVVLLAAIVAIIVTIGLLAACFGQVHRTAAAIRGIRAACHQAQSICCPVGSKAFSATARLCISARVASVSPVTSRSPSAVSPTLATRASSGSV
jgi:hypothetical protein